MASRDGIERELKFSRVELDKLRQRLIALEAERARASALEDNWVFDRDGELRDKECVLRLRKDGHGARLTYKGPVQLEGNVRVRAEHETGVGAPDALVKLFGDLGYSVARRYQKYREDWQIGGVTISLDHTPIGDFAEFEGEGAETIAKRCGFDPAAGERRSYLRLYDEYLKEHPDAPPDMTFP